MKRFTVAILALLYFTISTGMVVNIHYCMGKVSSVNVDVLVKNLCACGKKESNGCCKTEHKLIKLEDNHKASYADVVFPVAFHEIQSSFNLIDAPLISLRDKVSFSNHSPPILSKQDTYLQNCVFRI